MLGKGTFSVGASSVDVGRPGRNDRSLRVHVHQSILPESLRASCDTPRFPIPYSIDRQTRSRLGFISAKTSQLTAEQRHLAPRCVLNAALNVREPVPGTRLYSRPPK